VNALLDPLHKSDPIVFAGREGMKEAARALVRITGAPMQAPREREDFYDIHTDHPTWAAWWQMNQERFDDSLRYRFGEPYSGLSVVSELERSDVPMALRKLLAVEVGILLRTRPLQLHLFAAHQRAELARQRASVEAEIAERTPRFSAGAWPG
jgi:hypothetical protein